MKTRTDAQRLLEEWVTSESLRRHCLGVAVCMEAYARKNELNAVAVDQWWMCGLLHDFDWEKYPTLEEHPKPGCERLRQEAYDDELIEAILAHNPHQGIARTSDLAKTLFAVDELSGLVIALARVRPGAFDGMSPKSVKKAMKKKDFAAAVNRDDIRQGMSELGITSDEEINAHFQLVIDALANEREGLGL